MQAKALTEQQVRGWLAGKGVIDIDAVMGGIDTGKPMYLNWFHPGDKLVQFRDRPSFGYPAGGTSRWFTLPTFPSDELGALGIGHGPASRDRVELMVARLFQALETTAKNMDEECKRMNKKLPQPYDRWRGTGGGTQIFIPDSGLSELTAPNAEI